MTELDYARTYNAEFSRLNPQVPMNAKWDPIQQMKYLKELLARQQASGGDAYKVPYVDQSRPPTPAVTPVPSPTPIAQNPNLAAALSAARETVRHLEMLV